MREEWIIHTFEFYLYFYVKIASVINQKRFEIQTLWTGSGSPSFSSDSRFDTIQTAHVYPDEIFIVG